jgi:hypothetical protein
MINKIKRKKQLALVLLLLLCISFSHGQDTLIRKKYLDSIKNQLAVYTVTSYTHLNMFDKSQADLRKLAMKYQVGQDQFTELIERRRRENINYGVSFVFLMLLSFYTVTRFK